MSERRARILNEDRLPITRQCELLGVSRSTAYYQPKPMARQDLVLMGKIDPIHIEPPFYGSRRIRDELADRGHGVVNRKWIKRLMATRGLAALYPKRRTSVPGIGHKIYPYRLRGLTIDRANQVWAADICYIPMARGFMYLVAVMDWHTRRVLSWRLSNTMDSTLCLEALSEAIERFGAPEVFNTEQGARFTAEAFTSVLKHHEITISTDGKGRWVDNVFVERLWRSVKYEDIHLKAYESPHDLERGLDQYFRFYNARRRHAALGRRTPDTVYFGELHVPQAA